MHLVRGSVKDQQSVADDRLIGWARPEGEGGETDFTRRRADGGTLVVENLRLHGGF